MYEFLLPGHWLYDTLIAAGRDGIVCGEEVAVVLSDQVSVQDLAVDASPRVSTIGLGLRTMH